MIDAALAKGISVLNAAPYAGGALAKGVAEYPRLAYQAAGDDELAPLRRVESVCARYGIPPGAAALQFSLRDERIASTICGVSKPERIEQTLAWADWLIPDAAWQELLALPFTQENPEAKRDYKPG